MVERLLKQLEQKKNYLSEFQEKYKIRFKVGCYGLDLQRRQAFTRMHARCWYVQSILRDARSVMQDEAAQQESSQQQQQQAGSSKGSQGVLV